jgi:hypothetical protein
MSKIIIPTPNGVMSVPAMIASRFAEHARNGTTAKGQSERMNALQSYIGVQSHLLQQVSAKFSPKVLAQIVPSAQKMMKKIIDARFKSYAKAPTRIGDESYIERLTSLDAEMLSLDHLRGTLGTVAFVRSYNEETDKMVGYSITWFITIFFENDPDPRGIIYPMSNSKTTLEQDQTYIVWTDSEHFMMNAQGGIIPVNDNDDLVNPYGVLPVMFAHISDDPQTGEFCREPASDLVNAQEVFNVTKTQLSALDLYQSGGQPWVSGVNNQDDIKTGVDVIGLPEGAQFGFASPGGKPESLIASMRFTVETAAGNYGVSIKWASSAGGATSGEHQRILEIDLTASVEGDINYWRGFEQERAIIDNAILEAFGKTAGNLDEYSVDFAEANIPLTPTERIERDEWNLAHNQSTELQILMRNNPDLTKEAGEALLAENKEANRPAPIIGSLAQALATPSS